MALGEEEAPDERRAVVRVVAVAEPAAQRVAVQVEPQVELDELRDVARERLVGLRGVLPVRAQVARLVEERV